MEYCPPNYFEGGVEEDKEKAETDKEKTEAEEGDAKAKAAEAKAALDAAKNWRNHLPPFLKSKPGEISAFDSLTAVEYRSGTLMCFLLATFNVLSGITVMLIYMGHIFDNIDDHKQVYKLSNKQMSSALASSIVFGAATSVKVMAVATRR